ncbi:MAG TPA: GNAT family N-acetyltransferase [Chthoniobacterales bacterium]|nr:GNAT family N-acetyltransferase [Chthoniobacterales bacterium]
MKIVQAKPHDAEALTEIAHAAKRHWGYPESWIAAWRDILTMRPEFIAANVARVAIDEKRMLGFYVLTTEDDGIHLDHLWVVPAAMGRGIGRTLFEHAMMQARGLGFDSIKIEADPNAAAFYEKMGAVRVGVSATEIEGERRELPFLEFRVRPSS